jgi:hypothetical protein
MELKTMRPLRKCMPAREVMAWSGARDCHNARTLYGVQSSTYAIRMATAFRMVLCLARVTVSCQNALVCRSSFGAAVLLSRGYVGAGLVDRSFIDTASSVRNSVADDAECSNGGGSALADRRSGRLKPEKLIRSGQDTFGSRKRESTLVMRGREEVAAA